MARSTPGVRSPTLLYRLRPACHFSASSPQRQTGHTLGMKLGIHVSDFTWPGGPSQLGPTLVRIAQTAEAAGFDRLSVMDHVWQIGVIGPPEHYKLARTLNQPPALRQPHPPILIGGSGERKTLRLVAKYAQACNLFPSPELKHKLDVLRSHCEREGRDYDDIQKTVLFNYDVGD